MHLIFLFNQTFLELVHKTLQQYLKYNTKNNFHACLYFMMSILSRFTLLLNFFFFHWTLIFIFKVQSLTVDWRFAFHCRKTDVAQWKNSSNTLTLTVWFLLVLNCDLQMFPNKLSELLFTTYLCYECLCSYLYFLLVNIQAIWCWLIRRLMSISTSIAAMHLLVFLVNNLFVDLCVLHFEHRVAEKG